MGVGLSHRTSGETGAPLLLCPTRGPLSPAVKLPWTGHLAAGGLEPLTQGLLWDFVSSLTGCGPSLPLDQLQHAEMGRPCACPCGQGVMDRQSHGNRKEQGVLAT